jgi:hypothetical protein
MACSKRLTVATLSLSLSLSHFASKCVLNSPLSLLYHSSVRAIRFRVCQFSFAISTVAHTHTPTHLSLSLSLSRRRRHSNTSASSSQLVICSLLTILRYTLNTPSTQQLAPSLALSTPKHCPPPIAHSQSGTFSRLSLSQSRSTAQSAMVFVYVLCSTVFLLVRLSYRSTFSSLSIRSSSLARTT